ncbi:hypothetical protein Hypma_014965 [Hypsizygus marmoreus]|uniref:Uncharacterized protein n=1 Tax=Hypsizygus marmoreus TaxID=39966 RepID=A0A369K4V3_HYPMA|nr:hypothetical protein Hypma_014965 [Hypsizygus marmoreus]
MGHTVTAPKLRFSSTFSHGPFFVGLAVILISTGTICFFDVIMPTLSYPIISLPVCVLIALNLLMHYFYHLVGEKENFREEGSDWWGDVVVVVCEYHESRGDAMQQVRSGTTRKSTPLSYM